MRLLCPITDWKTEEVKRGRGTGGKTTTRLVICADNYNWLVALQNEKTGTCVGQKFHSGFKDLIPQTMSYFGIDLDTLKNAILTELSKHYKAEPTLVAKIHGLDDPKEVGKKIDEVFKINYNIHDDVVTINKKALKIKV